MVGMGRRIIPCIAGLRSSSIYSTLVAGDKRVAPDGRQVSGRQAARLRHLGGPEVLQ